jgi:hypothetical protein
MTPSGMFAILQTTWTTQFVTVMLASGIGRPEDRSPFCFNPKGQSRSTAMAQLL